MISHTDCIVLDVMIEMFVCICDLIKYFLNFELVFGLFALAVLVSVSTCPGSADENELNLVQNISLNFCTMSLTSKCDKLN